MGSPGRVVREITEAQAARLKKSADHYVDNMRRYLNSLKADERL
jgi:carbonic anhydrase/acetyltransferase-like protein (isoleucine patch superfamily)